MGITLHSRFLGAENPVSTKKRDKELEQPISELFLWIGNHSLELKWTVTLFIVLTWMIGSSMLHAQVIRPMQTLSNMVAAIREEDFSFRLRGGGREDSLADLIFEINSLAIRLQQQKISALEATALLKKVMMEIDVAVFTFDQQQRLRIVNRAGEQLMGRIAPRMLVTPARQLDSGGWSRSASLRAPISGRASTTSRITASSS